MTCFYCKGDLKPSTTTHFVDLKKCIVIVKNVPCLECSKCGETVFTDEVAKRLDDIVKTVSSLMTEIAVVEYTSDKVYGVFDLCIYSQLIRNHSLQLYCSISR